MTEKIKRAYKVRNIDIKHDDRVYPEGSVIELDDEAATDLGKWLEPLADDAKPAKQDGATKTPKDGAAPKSNSENKDKA